MTVTTFIEHLLCAGTLLGALHASSPFTNCPAAGRQVSGLAEVTQPVRGTAGIQTQVCVALKLKSSPTPWPWCLPQTLGQLTLGFWCWQDL